MTNFSAQLDALEGRFVAWAERRADIRAAIVVGSRARTDHPADEWADLDVGVLVERPQRYLQHHGWLRQLGSPVVKYKDPTGPSLHVLFEDGADAGFAFLPANAIKQAVRVLPLMNRFPALLRALPAGLGARLESELAGAAAFYRRGYRVILDKDGLAERFLSLAPAGAPQAAQPTEKEFHELVSHFWFVTVWTAKHVKRGELWWAKTNGCDGQLKAMLLQMIEWHERSSKGWDYDTWEGGRFLEEWADKAVVNQLMPAFAHYEAADVWMALKATMDIFRDLATRTSARLGYTYPQKADDGATAFVTQIAAAE
ncbi:MAG TPA: aminoglycoside 6-adenylyltransferase [Dehalococcoidia bacterium]|nr:aminoglycoside 6-adenylyltransferase [Dehalococcoidia bacterium]